MHQRNPLIFWLKILLGAGFLLFLIFSAEIDLAVARIFFHQAPDGSGQFFQSPLTEFLYNYGSFFGLIPAILAAVLYLLSFFSSQLKKWRPAALTLMLTLAIGAGILINGLFKEFWGRPRPKQVIEFGGKHPFRPFYQPNFHHRADPEKSFPSGHTAMGFYFITFCFIGKRYRNQWIYWFGFTMTLCLGFGLLLTRIAQGGHFLTDTVFSIIIMWSVAYLVDRMLLKRYVIHVVTSREYPLSSDA